MNLNKVILIGRVTKELEKSDTKTGVPLVSFSLATNRKIKDQEDKVEFHNITAFGKTADILCDYVVKGQLMQFTGRLETTNFPHRKDPEIIIYRTSIIVDEFQFGQKPAGYGNNFTEDERASQPNKENEDTETEDHSDIPF